MATVSQLPRFLPPGAYVPAWRSPVGELRPPRPAPRGEQAGSIRWEGSRVGRVLAALADLGIDPPGAAVEAFEQAKALRSESRREADPGPDLRRLSVEVASGETKVAAVGKAVAALPSAIDQDQASRVRQVLREASILAYRQAAAELAAAGDDLIASGIRPLVTAALDAQRENPTHTIPEAETAWRRAHDVAALLRSCGFAASANRPGTFDHTPYRYRRPDEVYLWQLDRAERARPTQHYTRPTGREPGLLFYRLEGAPAPTLRDAIEFEETWGPGLYLAAEVVEHAQEWTAIGG